MENKMDYEELDLEIIQFDAEDIVTSSPYEGEPVV